MKTRVYVSEEITDHAANDLVFGDHASQRMRQRGLRLSDLELVLSYRERARRPRF